MKQASLIVTLGCIGFAIGLAAFISSRLSEQAVALMAGTLFGMIVALPIGALIGWYVKGQRPVDRSAASQPMVIMTQPQPASPQPFLSSTANPVWPGAYPLAANAPQLPPRKYTIGGEEIVSHESDAVW
jgi:hypothetical protein